MDKVVAEIQQLRADVIAERRQLSKEERKQLKQSRHMYNANVEKIVAETREENRHAKEVERQVIRDALADMY
jgi:hypothetical protein